MSDLAKDFLTYHSADDIVYALRNREYYELSAETHAEIAGFVFRAINAARDKLNQA